MKPAPRRGKTEMPPSPPCTSPPPLNFPFFIFKFLLIEDVKIERRPENHN